MPEGRMARRLPPPCAPASTYLYLTSLSLLAGICRPVLATGESRRLRNAAFGRRHRPCFPFSSFFDDRRGTSLSSQRRLGLFGHRSARHSFVPACPEFIAAIGRPLIPLFCDDPDPRPGADRLFFPFHIRPRCLWDAGFLFLRYFLLCKRAGCGPYGGLATNRGLSSWKSGWRLGRIVQRHIDGAAGRQSSLCWPCAAYFTCRGAARLAVFRLTGPRPAGWVGCNGARPPGSLRAGPFFPGDHDEPALSRDPPPDLQIVAIATVLCRSSAENAGGRQTARLGSLSRLGCAGGSEPWPTRCLNI